MRGRKRRPIRIRVRNDVCDYWRLEYLDFDTNFNIVDNSLTTIMQSASTTHPPIPLHPSYP
jgi:hypothetical protein